MSELQRLSAMADEYRRERDDAVKMVRSLVGQKKQPSYFGRTCGFCGARCVGETCHGCSDLPALLNGDVLA